ncbi:hypothetical protein [Streptomyces chattanoogensis]
MTIKANTTTGPRTFLDLTTAMALSTDGQVIIEQNGTSVTLSVGKEVG